MLGDLIAIISKFVLETISALGSFGVFTLMALESANIPIPSEVIMPFSGFLVSRGEFNFWGIVTVGAFGNLVGSLVSYYAASHVSGRIGKKWELAVAQRWFDKFGIWSIFIGRLLPIIRTFISFPAGIFKVNIWKFSLLTFLGSFIWSWLMTYIGFLLGENWDIMGPYFRKFDFVIAGAVIVVVVWWLWGHFRRKQFS